MTVTRLDTANRVVLRRLDTELRAKRVELVYLSQRTTLDVIVARFVPVPGDKGNKGDQGIQGIPGLAGDGNIDGFPVDVTTPVVGQALFFDGTKFTNGPTVDIINGGAF